jgi:CubicO group peptidase (beta-lactamase class C family)
MKHRAGIAVGVLACSWLALTSLSCTGETEHHLAIPPEQAGYSPEALNEIEGYLEKIDSAAFVALHDGEVFMAWGYVETKYPVHSIRKALVSALYGNAIKRGEIDLDSTLEELGIDDIEPALTDEEKLATVRDVISSRSGVYHPAAAEAQAMIDSRPPRGSHRAGEHFYYNNWDFNVAGTILEQATGESIYETFEREIAVPIGMTQFSSDDGFYMHQSEKSQHPAYHFWMNAMDLAQFGVLYQKHGRWDGRQIVPEDWIDTSTRSWSVYSEEMGLGYGYMWHTFLQDDEYGHAFFHTGAGVHMLAVLPDIKLVWVHRVNTESGKRYRATSEDLGVLWEMILRARLDESDLRPTPSN